MAELWEAAQLGPLFLAPEAAGPRTFLILKLTLRGQPCVPSVLRPVEGPPSLSPATAPAVYTAVLGVQIPMGWDTLPGVW